MSLIPRYGVPLALLALAGGAHPALAQATDYSTTVVTPFFTNVASFDTTTTAASPTFTRPAIVLGGVTPPPLNPSGIGTNVGYATHDFTPTDSNQYRVTTTIDSGYAASNATQSSNLVQVLYQAPFDPTDKTFANALLAFNPAGTTGSYTTNLDAGQNYTFVNGGRYNIGSTGSQFSLGTVTTKVDEYNQGSLMTIPEASTLQPGSVSQSLTLFGGGPITSFNSFDIVGLNQNYLGGLTATLTHNGVSVNLFDRVNSDPSNDNQGAAASFNGSNYYFTDTGTDLPTAAAAAEPQPGSLADPKALVGGIANPYKSLNSLSAFDGLGVGGIWTLTIKDSDQGDIGSFLGFSFNATATPPAVPEASTWLGMSVGVLALTLMAFKRRRTAAATS